MLALPAARGSGAHRGGQIQSSLRTQGEDGDSADGPTPRALQQVWAAFPETVPTSCGEAASPPVYKRETEAQGE